MKTENEIRALPLEDQQKLVIELKTVPSGDKNYETAMRLIKFTEALKGYKAPELIEVKNVAGHDITVDGKSIANDNTAKVFPWQFAALRRYLEKVAALLLLSSIFYLLSSCPLQAQIQPYVTGNPTTYNVQAVFGYDGWTNLLATATNYSAGGGAYSNIITGTATYYTAAVTNSTSVITNANWSLVNGVPTNAVTYTTNTVLNQPGVVSLVNYDAVDLFIGGQLLQAGTGTNLVATWDLSDDQVNWRTNALTQNLILNGATYVGINTQLTLVTPGYIRLDDLATSAAGATVTNVTVLVAKKPYRTGP